MGSLLRTSTATTFGVCAVGVRAGEVDREARVAVGVAGDLLAVEEHDRVHVDAVELQRDGLAGLRAR